MPDYLITPKTPLLFRDGKPFGTADNIADTLAFPLPSTIAGAMRTAWAESQTIPFNYTKDADKLIKKRVLGPLLTRTHTQKQQTEVLFPTPADSICLNTQQTGRKIYSLSPNEIEAKKEGTDLPDKLLPVFLNTKDKSKPAKNTPKFWTTEAMTQWLIDHNTNINADEQTESLPIETRTHVTINPKTKTNHRSHLFQTAGLDFNQQRIERSDTNTRTAGWKNYQYGLLSWFQEDLPETFRTIGGEARLGHIQKKEGIWPDCPKPLQQAFVNLNPNKQGIRLILATPAIFKNGYLPDFLDEKLQGKLGNIHLTLKAASIPRWQAGTSWDMASNSNKQNSKKGTGMRKSHRLVPAGAVYWFDFAGSAAELQHHWLTSISDGISNKHEKDGFGLILPGIWTKTQNSKDSQ